MSQDTNSDSDTSTLERVQHQIIAMRAIKDYQELPLDSFAQNMQFDLDYLLNSCTCWYCHELYYFCKCTSDYSLCPVHLTTEQSKFTMIRRGRVTDKVGRFKFRTTYECGYVEETEL